jgi:hypothetical protein
MALGGLTTPVWWISANGRQADACRGVFIVLGGSDVLAILVKNFMVFKLDIFDDELVRRNGSGSYSIINIGLDDVSNDKYSLLFGLEPSGGGILEFYFYLTRDGKAEGDETDYWCGADVAKFIEPADRAKIFHRLVNGSIRLLWEAKPQRFMCFTHDANLPEKALLKHEKLLSVFAACLYEVTSEKDSHGRWAYMMERQAFSGIE